MQRDAAVVLLRDTGPKGAQQLLKGKLGESANQYWLFLGRLRRDHVDYTVQDDQWTVIAVCKETLKPYSNSGTMGHLESVGSMRVEETVSEHGYAHQHTNGIWIWFADQKAASPNA